MNTDSETTDLSSDLVLRGLDGGNPLGFLAAVGTARTAATIWPEMRIKWQMFEGGWRPVLSGCGSNQSAISSALYTALMEATTKALDISKKLPFEADEFAKALAEAQRSAAPTRRRTADFLVSFGTEICPDKNGSFQDTRFRMVRSGDSAGQGLPAYAKSIREDVRAEHLSRALFEPWDYQDSGFSFRWDPLEDQRYALRWRDPSKSTLSDGPGTMIGANVLALEALQLFPTMIAGGIKSSTTGFYRNIRRATHFIWPIWTPRLNVDVLRSILSLRDLATDQPPRERLAAMGIVEIFQSQRIQQNQYYSNFAPAQPA